MWVLYNRDTQEVEKVIHRPVNLVINKRTYPRDMFTRWTKQQLLELTPTHGIYRVIPDSRPNSTFYAGHTSTYTLDAGLDEFRETIAPIERDLDTIKTALKLRVEQLRDMKIVGGVVYNGKEVDTDDRSRTTLTGLVALLAIGGDIPANIPGWRARDNSYIAFNAKSDVALLAGAISTHFSNCWAMSWTKKAEIDALTTFEALQSYDVEADWPETVD